MSTKVKIFLAAFALFSTFCFACDDSRQNFNLFITNNTSQTLQVVQFYGYNTPAGQTRTVLPKATEVPMSPFCGSTDNQFKVGIAIGPYVVLMQAKDLHTSGGFDSPDFAAINGSKYLIDDKNIDGDTTHRLYLYGPLGTQGYANFTQNSLDYGGCRDGKCVAWATLVINNLPATYPPPSPDMN